MTISYDSILTLGLLIIGNFISFTELLAQDSVKYKPIYEGNLPTATAHQSDFVPANLMGKSQECLTIKSDSSFEVFQFIDNKWETLSRIPLTDSAANYRAWTTGDMDNNSKEEIIIAANKSLRSYEWDGKQFKMKMYEFPYLTDDILIGDIDNDKLNELVLFCYQKPSDPEVDWYPFSLCVAKYSEGTINLIWTDGDSLKYSRSGSQPPDYLVSIADIENTGHNQLILALAQSDVSPTKYNLLQWDKDHLELNKSFEVSKGMITTKVYFEVTPFILDKIYPRKIDGKTMFLATLVDSWTSWTCALLKIENNQLFIVKNLFDYSGNVLPNSVHWMNIDGKGQGILSISYLKSGGKMFRYYRF